MIFVNFVTLVVNPYLNKTNGHARACPSMLKYIGRDRPSSILRAQTVYRLRRPQHCVLSSGFPGRFVAALSGGGYAGRGSPGRHPLILRFSPFRGLAPPCGEEPPPRHPCRGQGPCAIVSLYSVLELDNCNPDTGKESSKSRGQRWRSHFRVLHPLT
jgi:hypothetical protein